MIRPLSRLYWSYEPDRQQVFSGIHLPKGRASQYISRSANDRNHIFLPQSLNNSIIYNVPHCCSRRWCQRLGLQWWQTVFSPERKNPCRLYGCCRSGRPHHRRRLRQHHVWAQGLRSRNLDNDIEGGGPLCVSPLLWHRWRDFAF